MGNKFVLRLKNDLIFYDKFLKCLTGFVATNSSNSFCKRFMLKFKNRCVNMKKKFNRIAVLANALEENDIDNFKFPEPVSQEQIDEWEKSNNAKLPTGYKNFIALANGFRKSGSEIYPLSNITKLDFPDDFKGYYAIGSFIGDGSLILSDAEGNFYYGDHCFGVEKGEFEEFIDKWIIRPMLEHFTDNSIEIPV